MKVKQFIKSLELRWSDLAYFLGFFPFAILLIFGQLFMQYPNPNDVAFPLWAAIPTFILMIGLWGYYIFAEVIKKRNQFNRTHTIVVATLCSLVALNIIAIFVQPSIVHENVFIRASEVDPSSVGKLAEVIVPISVTHRVVFIFELIAAAMLIYTGLFVFPKRFTSLKFIKYLGWLLFGFLLALIVFGYIAEFDKYVGFIKYVLNIDRTADNIYVFAVQSFILHRNAYGMMMMVGIIFTLICHSFDKKWYYYAIAAFLYINMIFSLCKTGLLISALVVFIYVIYRLVSTYKERKKFCKTALISIFSVVLVVGVIFGIALISKGKVFGKLYSLIESITGGGGTIETRTFIWDNSYQLMRNGWWLIGRGFGTFNTMLMPMNDMTHADPVFPSHSSYIGLVAEGGILYLLAYIALLCYAGYAIYKSYKKDPALTLAISLGVLSFVLYSFIETIHYFVYVFLFPIMVIYNSKEKEAKPIEQ